jgi:hypothetical protein
VLAARIDQLDTHGEVVIVGGVLFVWFALLGVLGRYERCGGDGEAEREAAGANPFSQIPELTDAERAVADTLPIGDRPR